MLQAIGLTSRPGRSGPPAVRDLSFEAGPGQVTALFGPAGAGKSTALRLMLELEPGRGITYFRGNPLHRIAHPAREVGALLGDVPGHPARTARGQLRMLCAAAGVALARADELLRDIGLTALGDQRLDALPLAADRRLGIAAALLGAPQTLLLDEPGRGLTAREQAWQYGLMRAHADRGGTVLWTTDDPKEAARIGDRVVTVDGGRLIADQEVVDFARTRLRPRVVVCTPYAARLASLLHREARVARRSVEVVVDAGSELSVYGSNCAEVGEIAYRHRVLVHRLTEEAGGSVVAGHAGGGTQERSQRQDRIAIAPLPPQLQQVPDRMHPSLSAKRDGEHPEGEAKSECRVPAVALAAAPGQGVERSGHLSEPSAGPSRGSVSAVERIPSPPPSQLPGQAPRRPLRSPLRPVRYELLRLLGVRTAALVFGAALLASPVLSLLLARSREVPVPVAIAAWPDFLPLPPAALCAGLIGALSFGEEFRYPVLAARGTVPRRVALLLAKMLVTGAAAVLIALLVAGIDTQVLAVVYGREAIVVQGNLSALLMHWCALAVGCAWAGLLAAGVFRVTAAGVAAVLLVPVVIAPLVRQASVVPSARSTAGLPDRVRELAWFWLPQQADDLLLAGVRMLAQPVGTALVLSLAVLVCMFVFVGLRRRTHC
ncbi:ATP-binding cassette domain-containing protein [Streptomyces sp. NPDC059256]|uniref:ATP-binding cassette domain-containing protein n=1 Tax=Streptomyces sp. NPDC059256 TaxID=3346794 RepID=UPI00368C88A5